MDLPPPQPNLFERPAHVIELPAEEVPGNKIPINKRGHGEEISEIEPDPMPDDPMTAKQVITYLYDKGIVKDKTKRAKLLKELESFEKKDSSFPSSYLSKILELKRTKVLAANDLEEVILDFGPLATIKISSLVSIDLKREEENTFLKQVSFHLQQRVQTLLQLFRELEPSQRDEFAAA